MTAINTNTAALNAQYYLKKTNQDMESAMARLSSGKKVNSAADDAAGLAIAGRMTSQLKGLDMAIKNANDTISMAQTAEGAMEEVSNMLQRIRELAVQSANGTMNASDRASLDAEVQSLKAEIDRVASTTTFNSQNLLDGSFDGTFQIGDKAGQTVDVKIGSVLTSSLGMGGGSAGSNTVISARMALGAVDAGDIEINGQALGEILAADDIEDIIKNVSDNVDNVTASSFNVVVAKTKGDGVTADNQLQIKVAELGVAAANATTYKISASASMEELVANINNETGGVVKASINEEGKLVLANDTGATINVQDSVAGAGTYGDNTGFFGDADFSESETAFAGFLKLESADGSPVRIEAGNKGLATTGSDGDLATLGFRRTTGMTLADSYSVIGAQITGPTAALAKGDLSINGVEIFDANITVDSMTKKLELINSKTVDTGVTASAFFEQTFAIDTDNLMIAETFKVNGIDITLTAKTISDLETKLNAAKANTGLTATVSGNNLTLSGENVQALTIAYEDKTAIDATMNAATTNEIAAGATAAAAVVISLADVDAQAGRTYELKVESSATGGLNQTVTYKASSSDTSQTILDALGTKLRNSNAAYQGTVANTFAVADDAGNNKADLTTAAALNFGDAKVTFGVQTAGIVNPLGSAATTYARLKLDSVANQPIKVDLGSSTTAANHAANHGFFEQNVGAADFDVNEPMLSAAGGQSMSGLSVSSASTAAAALKTLDNAIDSVNAIRGDLGAVQNRLSYTVNNLSSISNATAGAKGRIIDADFAAETSELTKQQILSQAATSMLAQANQSKQGVLALLQ